MATEFPALMALAAADLDDAALDAIGASDYGYNAAIYREGVRRLRDALEFPAPDDRFGLRSDGNLGFNFEVLDLCRGIEPHPNGIDAVRAARIRLFCSTACLLREMRLAPGYDDQPDGISRTLGELLGALPAARGHREAALALVTRAAGALPYASDRALAAAARVMLLIDAGARADAVAAARADALARIARVPEDPYACAIGSSRGLFAYLTSYESPRWRELVARWLAPDDPLVAALDVP